jgi:hypothetical protein
VTRTLGGRLLQARARRLRTARAFEMFEQQSDRAVDDFRRVA